MDFKGSAFDGIEGGALALLPSPIALVETDRALGDGWRVGQCAGALGRILGN
jgi:hypothetical protein